MADEFVCRGYQFDALHYAGMSVYKIGIILFNLVPFLALLYCSLKMPRSSRRTPPRARRCP